MVGVVEYLFGAAGFVPHGYCLLWRPDLVAMHASSDLLIAAAYFSIPVALVAFQRRRRDLAYPWMFRLFAAFITLCGVTHLIGLWSLWQPVYGFQALVKLATAAVSVATAISLWPLLPKALALPSPAMLRVANDSLAAEIDRRRESEAMLRRAHDGLEQRVAERTAELVAANARLAKEVADHRQTEGELRRALDRLQQHMLNTPLGVIELELPTKADGSGRIALWSGQAGAILRWTAAEVEGRAIDEVGVVDEADLTKWAVALGDLMTAQDARAVFVLRCRTRQHELRHCRCHASIVRGEGETGTILILVEDITERVSADAHIYRLAHHDLVTGLPNRLLFHDRLTQALARARRDGNKLALLMLDLDRFKEVNDALGHAAGDQLLQLVAERLKSATRESDTLARLGGDEFGLVQTALTSDAGTALMTRRLLAALEPPCRVEGHETPVSVSIGVTVFPDDGDTVERLMRNADMALYHAKAAGRATASRYHASMGREVQASRSLQRRIREGLEQDQFRLAYQPIVDLASGSPVAREALLRLDHPGGGPIPPAALIPVAEASGLIQAVGAWVLERACRDAAGWAGESAGLGLAVNLSPAQLRHQDLVPAVERALASSGLDPQRLELEITESIFLDPSLKIITEALDRLAGMGVALALDDFGTGYSSLGYLKHFPFRTIKLDASFVREIGSGGESIVLAVLSLGHNLGKQVIAEGIEREEQRRYLLANGCRLGQGYLLGRPASLSRPAS